MTIAATARVLHATSSRTSYIQRTAAAAAARATAPFPSKPLSPSPRPNTWISSTNILTTSTSTSIRVSITATRPPHSRSCGHRAHSIVNNNSNRTTTTTSCRCCHSGTAMSSSYPSAGTETTTTTSNTTTSGTDAGDVRASELWADVVQVYDRAQAGGACSKTDTQVELLYDATLKVTFVLRLATVLNKKPTGPLPSPPPSSEGRVATQPQPAVAATATSAAASPAPASAPWRNPFLPPEPDLFVRHLGPEHSLVLNKFNVVAHHVLVITREFRSQAEPLYGSDLAATLEVLQAMPNGGVAFYNCGPQSGRSQPHKHLQVVPLPFTGGQPIQAPVQNLVDQAVAAVSPHDVAPLQPLAVRHVPYRCYVGLLPDSPSPDQLETAFNALLQQCFPGYQYTPPAGLQPNTPPRHAASAAVFATGSVSYNVLLTRRWLMLLPRSAERCGPLALNSLSYAGTMLVRSQNELEYVRQMTPAVILARIGEPWQGKSQAGEGSKM